VKSEALASSLSGGLAAPSLCFVGTPAPAKRVDDLAHVLGTVLRHHEDRVARIDHAHLVQTHRRHQTAALAHHDATVRIDGQRVSRNGVPARVERAHFRERREGPDVAPADGTGVDAFSITP